MTYAEWVLLEGTSLPINATKKQGCYVEMLAALKSQMDAMLEHYSKVIFLRIDIRQREYSSDNQAMSNFMRKLKKRLSKRYKTARIAYLWAREIEKAKQQHYHLVLMLDARKVQHPAKIVSEVEYIADLWDWPKPYTPRKCYRILARGDGNAYSEAFYRGSYLAKTRGKNYKSDTANNYGRSVIKPPESSRKNSIFEPKCGAETSVNSYTTGDNLQYG